MKRYYYQQQQQQQEQMMQIRLATAWTKTIIFQIGLCACACVCWRDMEWWKEEKSTRDRREKNIHRTNANLIQMCFEIYSVITLKASFDIEAKVKVNEKAEANGIQRRWQYAWKWEKKKFWGKRHSFGLHTINICEWRKGHGLYNLIAI